jgi:hypothetical protein
MVKKAPGDIQYLLIDLQSDKGLKEQFICVKCAVFLDCSNFKDFGKNMLSIFASKYNCE